MAKVNNILIVANSGRMLASSSKNAGFNPLVIDCFADVDTQEIALDYVKVYSLAVEHVKAAFSILNKQHMITNVIYGSGLERYIDTVNFLHRHLNLLGNTPEVFSSIQNKSYFFSRLNHLQIPYPEVSFKAPDAKGGWLTKPMQGEGGLGIKKYKGVQGNSRSCYWQKYTVGTPMSVLFIANGTESEIIGFNKQCITHFDDNEFLFSGVISQPEINRQVVQCVSLWLEMVVPEFSLKGMNSLDFVVNNNCSYALEVNARPSASMQLYQDDLLAEHVKCCINDREPLRLEGKGRGDEDNKSYKAYQIFFAESDVFITEKLKWPLWVVDIPQTGSFIHTGMPICSIIAGGKNEQQLIDTMLFMQLQLKQLLQ